MNRSPWFALSAAAMVLFGLLLGPEPSRAGGGGGRVAGRVAFAKGVAPPRGTLKVTKDNGYCGSTIPSDEFIVGKDGGLKGVVLQLKGPGLAGHKATPTKITLEQRGCRYEPHVSVAPRGSKIKLVNNDDILHNVHAYGRGNRTLFNIAQPTKGAVQQKKLRTPGKVRIGCDVHSWMGAWVVVVSHPFFAVTKADGSFEIKDVPPGDYEIEAWHEGTGQVTKKVTVTAGATSKIDFIIGAN